MGKSKWVSKTLWVNTLVLIGTGAGWMAGSLSSYPEVVAGLVIAQALVNILLRFVTVEPIA
jgi:hypothetical protein